MEKEPDDDKIIELRRIWRGQNRYGRDPLDTVGDADEVADMA